MVKDTTTILGTADVLWQLKDLYPAPDALEIERDIVTCKQFAQSIASDYAGRIGELDGEQLIKVVQRLEKLDTLLAKLDAYAFLNFTTQTDDAEASALVQKVEELSADVGGMIIFFRLEWSLVDEQAAALILDEPQVAFYRHYLSELRKFAPHQLSAKEEKLLQALGPVGRSAWNLLFEKLMGQMEFGQGRSEEEVLSDLYHHKRQVRKQAASELTKGLQTHLHLLAHIFNTLAAEKMIDDKLRRYDSWVSAMNLTNELEGRTVEILVEAVTGRYDIVHRYYSVKKKLLGYEELLDYDRYAPVGGADEASISWDKCTDIVLESFAAFSPIMAETAEQFFTHQWIHAPLKKGKRGGAFAHPCVPEAHPYIMVNYTGNIRDVSTVAHELGHGIHQFLAAERGFYNSDTTLVLAETASVFAEMLVFKKQLELFDTPEARQGFICQKLESVFATVFRQVAMNRFEDAMHNGRRELGELSPDKLSEFWLATQEPMYGDAVTLTDNYGIWWAYIPHFIGSPGYVYSYAFGELLVLALYSRYLEEGNSFVDKYLQLLAAGGSKSPYELLMPFGIDLNEPTFWQGGLRMIDSLLNEITE